jgi:hypothetical protein
MVARDKPAGVTTHTKLMTEALAVVSGAIAHAQETLHQRDVQDPLSPWSLEDIRSLRVAVQRTLEKLSKEEALFTGTADLQVCTSLLGGRCLPKHDTMFLLSAARVWC